MQGLYSFLYVMLVLFIRLTRGSRRLGAYLGTYVISIVCPTTILIRVIYDDTGT
ncbi:hypothetical protein F4677DRAFT_424516 [Hypoxylon crocopeplum]|nr:hypothetical protein F4677DRAFT_424516 [Hypoxylon crocopeplum]